MAKRKPEEEAEQDEQEFEEEEAWTGRESGDEGEVGSEVSGSEEEQEEEEEEEEEEVDGSEGFSSGGEETDGASADGNSSTVFGRAFGKIMKKRIPHPELTEFMGPVLAERKRLLVKQFEEAEQEKKAKISRKDEKREVSGKGHVLPQTYTDAKEKALIKLATKGVVRLFNAVSKAQKVQAETDLSSHEATKAAWKQSKAVFMTELGADTMGEVRGKQVEIIPEREENAADGGWAVLRTDFMLGTSSKLKDWDKSLADSIPNNTKSSATAAIHG